MSESWENICTTEGKIKIIGGQNPSNKNGAAVWHSHYLLYSPQFYYSVYKGHNDLRKGPKMDSLPNVQLYNDSNQIVMDKFWDQIAEMLSSLVV